MKKQYYYQRDGEKVGPFNEAQFRDLQLPPETLVWCYGMIDWLPLKDVDALQGKEKVSLNKRYPWLWKFVIAVTAVFALAIGAWIAWPYLEKDPPAPYVTYHFPESHNKFSYDSTRFVVKEQSELYITLIPNDVACRTVTIAQKDDCSLDEFYHKYISENNIYYSSMPAIADLTSEFKAVKINGYRAVEGSFMFYAPKLVESVISQQYFFWEGGRVVSVAFAYNALDLTVPNGQAFRDSVISNLRMY